MLVLKIWKHTSRLYQERETERKVLDRRKVIIYWCIGALFWTYIINTASGSELGLSQQKTGQSATYYRILTCNKLQPIRTD